MRELFLSITILFSLQLSAQTIFEENFDSLATGTDLTTLGYELSQKPTYDGTVTVTVFDDSGNKVARMLASPSGSAGMQIEKTIDVEAQVIYTFEMLSKGPYKRQLRVYSENDALLASTEDYKPSTTEEETLWKNMSLTFLSDATTTKVKIALHHYWSGTIDMDSIKVTKIGEPGSQTSYYLSSSEGDDSNDGTINNPWKSLDKISSAFLFPGDSVLFKRGDRFDGHFVVNGSGNEEKPILITSYGEGDLPIITGQVGEAGGGDYQEAILVENKDNLIFDGLEIQNERIISRSGVSDTDAYGIYVKNSGTKVMNNLLFRNMTFKNVFAAEPMLNPEDFDKIQVSGLAFHSTKNTETGKEKNINGIEVKDSYFGNLQRLGIKFSHSGGNEGIGNDSINRNMNIHIHNNEFYYNGGTGVLPNGTYNCLIENNIFDHPGADIDPRMPARGSAIWNYKAINTIMQYNTVISANGYLDSYGIHIDKHNKNTFVQYNYMVDCIGGFVEILANNTNAVYRFNVSVNSGYRYSSGVSTWKAGSSTIYIYSDRWTEENQAGLMLSDGVYVYNNTVVMDYAFETTFNVDAKNMFIYNNIFSSTNGAKMGYLECRVRENDTPFTMQNNLYEGDVNPAWIEYDTNPISGASEFKGVGTDKMAYYLNENSDAINAGVAISGPVVPNAGYGVFINIPPYPTVDFYGNAIDLSSGTPNIGACNTKDGIVGLNSIIEDDYDWLIYPKPADSSIHFVHKGDIFGEMQISLVNLKGQVVQTELKKLLVNQNEFNLQLNTNLQNGIYIVNIRGNERAYSRRILWHK
ncbi:T9SS type A sorting domain-containing protein [uncultured Draconibacterium sp.]|uniref:T9SS type A sorting domain-containing protein n=1 Tax=uncultured Draconibacterium sp. TaxID=1573823 RepID=UPI0025F640B1|nr:T9SS type A sorting domain-containing protein [uncultured Draconibacterium sp.]